MAGRTIFRGVEQCPHPPLPLVRMVRFAGIFVGLVFVALSFACKPSGAPEDVQKPRNMAGLYIEDSLVPEADTETLAEALVWLKTEAKDKRTYTILLQENEPSKSVMLTKDELAGAQNVRIELQGLGKQRKVELDGVGPLFTIGAKVTLVLGNNITLDGTASAGGSLGLVAVEGVGAFRMQGETGKVVGSKKVGVDLKPGATFVMDAGEISGNAESGVYVPNGSVFTLKGGDINDNGSGVWVSGGSFTMTGGTITGNGGGSSSDGGVFLNGGNFVMDGTGSITGNRAKQGGGVAVLKGAAIIKSGTISGNTAESGSQACVLDNAGYTYLFYNKGTIDPAGVSGNGVEWQ